MSSETSARTHRGIWRGELRVGPLIFIFCIIYRWCDLFRSLCFILQERYLNKRSRYQNPYCSPAPTVWQMVYNALLFLPFSFLSHPGHYVLFFLPSCHILETMLCCSYPLATFRTLRSIVLTFLSHSRQYTLSLISFFVTFWSLRSVF